MTVSTASHSSLVAHRECPQKWAFGYVKHLRGIERSTVERDFGSWWAMLRAADSISRGTRLGSLQWVPPALKSVDDGPRLDTAEEPLLLPNRVLVLASRWWLTMGAEYQATFTEVLGQPLHERLVSLCDRWLGAWSEETPSERPLAVEMRWERAIDADTVLVGYIDEVYWDGRRGMVVVRDDKTSKSLAAATTASDMMDSQLQLYAWGASPAVSAWGLGRIAATAYDRACSVAPKPPVLTKSGRLAQRGGEPSIASCDLDTYLRWAEGPDGRGVPYPGLKKDGSDGGRYEAEPKVVERLSVPAARSTWFQRTLTPLNAHLVKAHLRSAQDSARDMAASRLRVEETGEAARNLTSWGCRQCEFNRLCRAQMIGGARGDYDLTELGLEVRPGRAAD